MATWDSNLVSIGATEYRRAILSWSLHRAGFRWQNLIRDEIRDNMLDVVAALRHEFYRRTIRLVESPERSTARKVKVWGDKVGTLVVDR